MLKQCNKQDASKCMQKKKWICKFYANKHEFLTKTISASLQITLASIWLAAHCYQVLIHYPMANVSNATSRIQAYIYG